MAIGSHKTTVAVGRDGVRRLTYHATVVVSEDANGHVTLNSGGYRTVTTKRRMNEYAQTYGAGMWSVYSRDNQWLLHKPSGVVVSFYDGIEV